ncbi:cytochrome b [Beijerinckia indica]|uniref:Cytochrome B561 n=1 Tax=Beijerinckia indica subsp. indica (strain ATCC 9039 / DSM 1715 / NCIMB 8712) TaxID=395963 RepID=B2IJP1_BEII9|nr:cytochrome b [Beijerinckia indica]ACB94913.1 cytochrome B561 [Beijerinckia indica subsp. indica ATCC 9039]
MKAATHFHGLSRALHWIMAVLILAMLFIGVSMVSRLADYHWLVSLHKPIGIAILVLAAIRWGNRFVHPAPPLPKSIPAWQQRAALASHLMLYSLMFAMPLIGWAMLSAGDYPITLFGPLHLPAILPPRPALYALLRQTHTILAYLLFSVILAHVAAALFHALIRRDGVFSSMVSGKRVQAIEAMELSRDP